MKRILTLILTLVLSINMLLSVNVKAADNEFNDDAVFDVISLGIMQGDENGDLLLDKELTRAEFAMICARLIKVDSVKIGGTGFSDVSPDSWYYTAVSNLENMGIMSGTGDSQFRPDDTVTYPQAVKTLVMILGYGIVADEHGGYPDGYIYAASKIGLLKDVGTEDGFSRGSLVNLIYNALDIKCLEQTNFAPSGETFSLGSTLREFHTNNKNDSHIKKSGIVDANYFTYLNAPNSSIEPDEVSVNGIIYNVGDTNAAELIGQSVDFYYTESGRKNVIVSIKPSEDTTVTTVSFSDINNPSLSAFEYGDNDKIRISPYKTVVKNGRVLISPSDMVLNSAKANITFIDNNDDRLADVIFFYDYENVTVKEVRGQLIELKEKSTVCASKFIDVDPESDTRSFILTESNGAPLAIEDIKPYDILSICVDESREVWQLIRSSKKVTATYEEKGDDYIVADGSEYPLYTGYVIDEALGEYVDIYIDFAGYVAKIEKSMEVNSAGEKSSYGYISAVGSEGGISSAVKVKMLRGSKISFEYDENDDPDDKNSIPILICQNADVMVLETADRIRINGGTAKSADDKLAMITPGLYEFELNADGRLTSLEAMTYHAGGENMTYNVYDKVFAGNAYHGAVAIDDKTTVICLPTNVDATDNDYSVPMKITNRGLTTNYYVEGFNYDAESKKVELITLKAVMRASDTAVINENTSPVAMVSEISSVMLEDDIGLKIVLMTKSGKREYAISESDTAYANVQGLKTGDFIFYAEGLDDDLDNVRVIYSFADGIGRLNTGFGTSRYQVCGTVTDLEYDEPDSVTGNLMTVININNGASVNINMPQRNVPPIFIYNTRTKEVTQGSAEDIVPGEGRLLYVFYPRAETVKACIIFE